MSGNTWCVTTQDKIFDSKCVVAQVQFFPMGAHWFIWCHIKSNNFKNCLLPKVSERASLQIPMTLESTVSPANFYHRFTDCFKGDISPLNDNLKRKKVNVCHPDGDIRLKKYFLVLIMGHSFSLHVRLNLFSFF